MHIGYCCFVGDPQFVLVLRTSPPHVFLLLLDSRVVKLVRWCHIAALMNPWLQLIEHKRTISISVHAVLAVEYRADAWQPQPWLELPKQRRQKSLWRRRLGDCEGTAAGRESLIQQAAARIGRHAADQTAAKQLRRRNAGSTARGAREMGPKPRKI
jgi:hypothetical protein